MSASALQPMTQCKRRTVIRYVLHFEEGKDEDSPPALGFCSGVHMPTFDIVRRSPRSDQVELDGDIEDDFGDARNVWSIVCKEEKHK